MFVLPKGHLMKVHRALAPLLLATGLLAAWVVPATATSAGDGREAPKLRISDTTATVTPDGTYATTTRLRWTRIRGATVHQVCNQVDGTGDTCASYPPDTTRAGVTRCCFPAGTTLSFYVLACDATGACVRSNTVSWVVP